MPSNDDRPHVAARADAWVHRALDRRLRGRGWTPTVVPAVGYGAPGWARVLARVVLAAPTVDPGQLADDRGWRRFLTAEAAGVDVTVRLGDHVERVTTDGGGYVDVRLPCALPPGWHTAHVEVASGAPVEMPVRIVAPGPGLGLVSDIDDTVMVTMLPRPLVALRNAFVLRESARQPVPGMAELYREIVAAEPDVFVVYLSTGAWNTAGPLQRFLRRHRYPDGPLLLTDWGPTATGWFRSGQAHKRSQLRRLFEDFPELRWLLVGDDGQHDPSLYAEAAATHPDRVLGVAIRELSVTEQVATHGTATPLDDRVLARGVTAEGAVCAPDGFGLRDLLADRGLVLGRRG